MQTMEIYNLLQSAVISYKNDLDEDDSLFYINYLNSNNLKVVVTIYILYYIFTDKVLNLLTINFT